MPPPRESQAPFKHAWPVKYLPGITGYGQPGRENPGSRSETPEARKLEDRKKWGNVQHTGLCLWRARPSHAVHLVRYSSLLFSFLRHAPIGSHRIAFHFHSIQSRLNSSASRARTTSFGLGVSVQTVPWNQCSYSWSECIRVECCHHCASFLVWFGSASVIISGCGVDVGSLRNHIFGVAVAVGSRSEQRKSYEVEWCGVDEFPLCFCAAGDLFVLFIFHFGTAIVGDDVKPDAWETVHLDSSS